ncbi:hypothetical protein J6590_046251 [Homalodisca vitripennis]|nr:hypothetical protein J6590_046251 [Homalodisca vitripennis]
MPWTLLTPLALSLIYPQFRARPHAAPTLWNDLNHRLLYKECSNIVLPAYIDHKTKVFIVVREATKTGERVLRVSFTKFHVLTNRNRPAFHTKTFRLTCGHSSVLFSRRDVGRLCWAEGTASKLGGIFYFPGCWIVQGSRRRSTGWLLYLFGDNSAQITLRMRLTGLTFTFGYKSSQGSLTPNTSSWEKLPTQPPPSHVWNGEEIVNPFEHRSGISRSPVNTNWTAVLTKHSSVTAQSAASLYESVIVLANEEEEGHLRKYLRTLAVTKASTLRQKNVSQESPASSPAECEVDKNNAEEPAETDTETLSKVVGRNPHQ